MFGEKVAKIANVRRDKLFSVAISPKESDWKLRMGNSVDFYSHSKPPCARFSCSNRVSSVKEQDSTAIGHFKPQIYLPNAINNFFSRIERNILDFFLRRLVHAQL